MIGRDGELAKEEARTVQRIVQQAERARSRLFDALREQPSGRAWCREHSAIADRVLRALFQLVHKNRPRTLFVVVAVGGYGRREVAPFSDLDVTFLPDGEMTPDAEERIRRMFHLMIHVFGELDWPVGYAFRLPSDCPALDQATRTGLLDARLVAGRRDAFDSFRRVFERTFPVAEFLISKLEERRSNRMRWHETPRVVEFHLRDGAGGLRDVHTARWIAQALKRRGVSVLEDAYETLLAVRNVLHSVTDRKEDRLLRTRIESVADRMGINAQALAERVIRAGEQCDLVWQSTERLIQTSRFVLSSGGVFAERGVCTVGKSSNLTSAVIGVCRAARLGLRIERVKPPRLLGDTARINEYLTSGEAALRALDQSGLLDSVLPEFTPCRYLLSRDSVHRYTVGEHTLQVVRLLDESRLIPEFVGPWSEVTNHRPLYLAAILHDLGKVNPKRRHATAGVEIAEAVCERLAVTGDERRTVRWLVREHLLLADIARTHDLADPRTAAQLARAAERPDRLAMLYLLTYADTSAVGAELWTGPMATSAQELYERARAALEVPQPIEVDPALYRRQALKRLAEAQPGSTELESFLDLMPTHYLLGTSQAQFPLHADYVRRARQGEITVVFHHDHESKTTDVTVCMRDLPKPGLLSRLLGVFYALDINLHAVRAASTQEEHPIALDVLTVSFRGAPLPSGLCSVVAKEIRSRVRNRKDVDALLRQHGKDPEREQEVYRHRFHPGSPAVLEIETRLGRGMPYRVARMLASLRWNIQVARIGQAAGRAVARFSLSKPDGTPLVKAEVDRALRRTVGKV